MRRDIIRRTGSLTVTCIAGEVVKPVLRTVGQGVVDIGIGYCQDCRPLKVRCL